MITRHYKVTATFKHRDMVDALRDNPGTTLFEAKEVVHAVSEHWIVVQGLYISSAVVRGVYATQEEAEAARVMLPNSHTMQVNRRATYEL